MRIRTRCTGDYFGPTFDCVIVQNVNRSEWKRQTRTGSRHNSAFPQPVRRSPFAVRRSPRDTEEMGGMAEDLNRFSKDSIWKACRSRAISLPTTETETHKWPAHRTILFIFQSGALLTFALFGLCSCFWFYFYLVPPIQRNQQENKCRTAKGGEQEISCNFISFTEKF